jgi:hypothetical protein
MHKVFSDPEYLRVSNCVPFDVESEAETALRLEYEALYVFHRNEERRKSAATCRMLVVCVFGCLAFYALAYGAWRWFR